MSPNLRLDEGRQAANRKGRAAMTRKTYCGNLLWQSGLTLLSRDDGSPKCPAECIGHSRVGLSRCGEHVGRVGAFHCVAENVYRRVTSYTTRDSKEIAKLLAVVS